MKLHFLHGRDFPAQQLDDWGFDGPIILGVAWMAVTYQVHFKFQFKSPKSYRIARQITGWEEWDEQCLLMRIDQDLIKCGDKWYGDWELDP